MPSSFYDKVAKKDKNFNRSSFPTGQVHLQDGRLGIWRDDVGNPDVCQGAAVCPFERHHRHREPQTSLPRNRQTNISSPTPQLPAQTLRHDAAMLVQRRYSKTYIRRNSSLSRNSRPIEFLTWKLKPEYRHLKSPKQPNKYEE